MTTKATGRPSGFYLRDGPHIPSYFVDVQGCWIWTRFTDRDGYARQGRKGEPCFVHRANYEAFNGTIPAGMTIDHGTGVVSWQDPVPSVVPQIVTIRATNSVGNGTQSWQLSYRGGDLNGDGFVAPADLEAMVTVLLGGDPGPGYDAGAADVNCDGIADGEDIQWFVDLMLVW